ncbi:MAG: transposase [Flavobacteriales bacterium Tduv]
MRYIRFYGFRLEDQIPDHTPLCRFRNGIVAKNAYERLLKKIHKELEKHQAIVKTRVIVDDSIAMNPFSPKEDPTHVGGNRKEEGKKQIS